ncbi:DUF5819 family protein [Streptomyces sp. NPDC053367]|uniref:DUF5819 family protein n=1 Tax=Streptomyces sp. NPDC053367 TaxID=3365700 RepID=UPI0037D1F12E
MDARPAESGPAEPVGRGAGSEPAGPAARAAGRAAPEDAEPVGRGAGSEPAGPAAEAAGRAAPEDAEPLGRGAGSEPAVAGTFPTGPVDLVPPPLPPARPSTEPATRLVAGPLFAPDPSPALPGVGDGRRTGVAALAPRYQVGVALALAVVAVAVCVHLGMVFLHVAPSNTVSKKHAKVIDEWVYPEFEQNWKLFAPNPLQQNIAVQVRAQVRTADGERRTTGWQDLSAQDGRALEGNPLPSHTQQNELRRAWDFFLATHDADNRATGERGLLAESYLRRIAVLRLDRAGAVGPGGTVEMVQLRSRTTNVPPPDWSEEKVSLKPMHRVLAWWTVSADEAEGVTG